MSREKDSSVVFVGPGVMGEAMVKSLLAAGGHTPEQVVVSGPRPQRLEELAKRYGIRTSTDNRAAMAEASVVVLSVKPQSLPEVLQALRGAIPKEALVLSIIAGARLGTLVEGLQHDRVVRVMPNTPAQVQEGISVWIATQSVDEEGRETARGILRAFGDEIEVDDEDYLDMATALSGTGPAYTFLFMEAMVDAGVHLGFPRRIAERLVVQTVKGSVAFYEHSPSHLARLRNQVTSPGGTSAAALYFLEKAGLRTALSRAIWAAYERSVQLGRGQKRAPVGE